MLEKIATADRALTSLDLKCILLGTGMRYPQSVYDAIAPGARLEPPSNPFAANCVILPGDVAVHLNANESSPYGLEADEGGQVWLAHEGERIAPVSFPPASEFSRQVTSAGTPFAGIAVLEGRGLLAFFYMWPCEYVKTGETCSFCFQVKAEQMGFPLPAPSPAEVAEVIAWGLERGDVTEVQLTAGTRFSTANECAQYAEVLDAIEKRVGLDSIPSEIYCYMTAPKNPADIDQVFAAGADRVAHDLHVWDSALHQKHAPGHARKVTRAAQLRALEYISDRHGPNKAFSAFVAGLEPLDSMLEGAEYLAERGIVPAFSALMPPPAFYGEQPPERPGVEYYRTAQREFARLYKKHNLNPPGIPAGSHVSLCRDIYRHMDDILAEA